MTDYTIIRTHLEALYGEQAGRRAFEALAPKLARRAGSEAPLSERDAILITYGDQLRAPGQAPLRTLAEFADATLRGVVEGIHILPFYPYTSDDGFSVVDYRAIDPALGAWEDVQRLGAGFKLMFDAVVNHVSASSAYVRGFVADDPRYRGFVMTVDDPADPRLRQVVRPRALPLITDFQTAAGVKHVWTTFSADQVDLDFGNPDVLLEVLDVLLLYVGKGARFIRLDAIAFLWKELGTTCLHLPQTHRVIQLMRAVLDVVAPDVMLITETNVPHRDNVSYFGDGVNEAQMVYNFALPPLVVHTLRTGDARVLTQWAGSLTAPGPRATFFNFLASHDGIGLNPARGILAEADIDALVQGTLDRGGRINYKHNPDGSRSPYEMNINFLDAIAPVRTDADDDEVARRMVAAHAIMFSVVGVPAIYFHSLFGSRGWPQGIELHGHNRAINREKLVRADVERALSDPGSLRSRVFEGLKALLAARRRHAAFHPHGQQRVLELEPGVFAVVRTAPGIAPGDLAQVYRNRVVCLVNVTDRMQIVSVDWRALLGTRNAIRNVLTGTRFNVHGPSLMLQPHQVMWATA